MTAALLRIGPPLRHACRTVGTWIPLARIGRIFPDGGPLVNALVVASPARFGRPPVPSWRPIMRAVAVLSLLTLSLAARASAGELAGVTLPDRIQVDSRTLVLNGMGLREATFLKVDVYVAGLYLETTSSDPGAI